MSLCRIELDNFLKELLQINNFQDYGPNGLQIEGKEKLSKIAFAVSAQKHSINEAVKQGADCLIVHHGLFWKFHGTRTITGSFAKRVKPLIENEINLFGYHLPLDAHMEVGNAAAIANKIGLSELEPFGDYKGTPTGVKGVFKSPISDQKLREKLEGILSHKVMHSAPDSKLIASMGIITGGANSEWRLCIKENLDSYLTGEMSEHDWHESKEEGIHMFAGGHNATEQFGVQELMKTLSDKFDVECLYIPSDNPA